MSSKSGSYSYRIDLQYSIGVGVCGCRRGSTAEGACVDADARGKERGKKVRK